MAYRIAMTLLLLQQSARAFQTIPKKFMSVEKRWPSVVEMTAASLDSIPSLESILDDGHGHINSNLAQAIYEWEMALDGHDGHDGSAVGGKQFSTRDGLRLVDELARDILSSLTADDVNDVDAGTNDDDDTASRKSGISYNDLIQEGMIALMRAMSTYDNYKSHHPSATFQEYARDSIHSSFLHFLAHSSRPIRLPLSLQTTLRKANKAADHLRRTMGKEPSLVQVANAVKVPPEKLALYRKLHRSMVSRKSFVSVEDGIEVYDPTAAGVGMGIGLSSRRDVDHVDQRTKSSVGGTSDDDDTMDGVGSSSVTPLRDVLTDTEEINNPLSYTHHHLLNEELNEFLSETLTSQELTVIQLRFGMVDSKYGGKGWTANEIGHRLGLEHEDVVRVASGALEKLRKAASSTKWEEENDAFVEISL